MSWGQSLQNIVYERPRIPLQTNKQKSQKGEAKGRVFGDMRRNLTCLTHFRILDQVPLAVNPVQDSRVSPSQIFPGNTLFLDSYAVPFACCSHCPNAPGLHGDLAQSWLKLDPLQLTGSLYLHYGVPRRVSDEPSVLQCRL